MVSFWGKNNDPERAEPSDEDNQYHQEPDERTRLLPRTNPGYLDPDDPEVTQL